MADDTPLITSKNADYWFERFKERQDEYKETIPWRNHIEKTFPVTPLIALIGDTHIGSPHVDYEMLQRDFELIKNTDGVYVMFMGDLIDGFFFNPAQMEQIEQTPEQKAFMTSMLKELGEEDKIIAVWGGDHGGWVKKMGFSAYERAGDELQTHYMEGVGHITAKVGDQEYKITAAHKLPGSSIYNDAHPTVRAGREIPGADIYIGAHKHHKAYLEQVGDGFPGSAKNVHHIMLGTYKETDGYARKHGMHRIPEDGRGGSAIYLSADERRIVYDNSISHAIKEYTK